MVNKRTLLLSIGLIVIVGVGYFLASGEGLQGRLLGQKGGSSQQIDAGSSTPTDPMAGLPDAPPQTAGSAAAALPNTLQISLASVPVSRAWPVGKVNVPFAGIIFSCGDGPDCKIQSATLQGLLDDNGNASSFSATGVGQDHGTSLNSYVAAARLFSVGSGLVGPETPVGSDGKVTLQMNWTIAAGTSKIAYVVGNIYPNAYQNSNAENITFAIMAGTDVAYMDSDGNAKTAVGTVNTAPTTYVTTAQGGSITISVNPSTPKENILLAGTVNQMTSIYDFATTVEGFTVKKLSINNHQDGILTNDLGEYDNNVVSVSVNYLNSSGTPETKTSYLSSGTAEFSGLNFFIPANQTRKLAVTATLNGIPSGATVSESVELNLAFNNFEALGMSSGATYKADKIDASVDAASDLDFGAITWKDSTDQMDGDDLVGATVAGTSSSFTVNNGVNDTIDQKYSVGTLLCIDDNESGTCSSEDIYVVTAISGSGPLTITATLLDDAGDGTYDALSDPIHYSLPGAGYLPNTNLMQIYESKPTVSLNPSSPFGTRTVSASDNVFIFDVRADAKGDIWLREGLAGNDEKDPIETVMSDGEALITSAAGEVVDGAGAIEWTGASIADEDCYLFDEAYPAGTLDDYKYVSFWLQSSETDVTYNSLAITFDDNSACAAGGDDQYELGSTASSGATFVNGVKLASGTGAIAGGAADSWALVTVRIPTNLTLSASTYFGFSLEKTAPTVAFSDTDEFVIDGVVFHNEALVLDLVSDSDFNNAATFGQTAYLKQGGNTVAQGGIGFLSPSSAKVLFVPGGLNSTDPYYDIGVSAGQMQTFTLTVDSATLLDVDGGSDDPLGISFDLGSSYDGVVTAGDFWWNESNATVQWLGNVSNATLVGNILRY